MVRNYIEQVVEDSPGEPHRPPWAEEVHEYFCVRDESSLVTSVDTWQRNCLHRSPTFRGRGLTAAARDKFTGRATCAEQGLGSINASHP